jgi:hypothetical protein
MEGRAGELAQTLLKHGIKAMKIWPFDHFGATLTGPENPRRIVAILGPETAAGVLAHYLDNEDLKKGPEIVEDISSR